MQIKQLEKATSILEKIKKLDNEIIEIEKTAMLIANNDTEASFTLRVVDKDKVEENKDKVEFDEDGSISYRSMEAAFMGGLLPFISRREKPDENAIEIKNDISVNVSMQILGVLLHEKQNKRQILIKKLNNYGITI